MHGHQNIDAKYGILEGKTLRIKIER